MMHTSKHALACKLKVNTWLKVCMKKKNDERQEAPTRNTIPHFVSALEVIPHVLTQRLNEILSERLKPRPSHQMAF